MRNIIETRFAPIVATVRTRGKEIRSVATIAAAVPAAAILFSIHMADQLPKGPEGETPKQKAKRFQAENEGKGKPSTHNSGKEQGKLREGSVYGRGRSRGGAKRRRT